MKTAVYFYVKSASHSGHSSVSLGSSPAALPLRLSALVKIFMTFPESARNLHISEFLYILLISIFLYFLLKYKRFYNVLASGVHQSDSVLYIYIYNFLTFFQLEVFKMFSSLCYTVDPYWLSILYIYIYIYLREGDVHILIPNSKFIPLPALPLW